MGHIQEDWVPLRAFSPKCGPDPLEATAKLPDPKTPGPEMNP